MLMDISRQEFKELKNRSNRTWSWTADSLHVVFPYEYNFAAAFEEVSNCFAEGLSSSF